MGAADGVGRTRGLGMASKPRAAMGGSFLCAPGERGGAARPAPIRIAPPPRTRGTGRTALTAKAREESRAAGKNAIAPKRKSRIPKTSYHAAAACQERPKAPESPAKGLSLHRIMGLGPAKQIMQAFTGALRLCSELGAFGAELWRPA